MKVFTPYLSLLEAEEEPILSAGVFLISGEKHNYFFDVGNSEKALAFLNSFSERIAIISHFHADHFGNISRTSFQEIYLGNEAYRHIHYGIRVLEPLKIEDGISLLIEPLPSSHAKGSLLLNINQEITLIGDATGPNISKGSAFYNPQLLQAMIKKLEDCNTRYFIRSHEEKLIPKMNLSKR